MKQKELWEILVPYASNEREKYSLDYHQEWDRQVREITGGLTIMGTAKGQWVSHSGELFVERMIPVRIRCDRGEIEQIVDLTIAHYD